MKIFYAVQATGNGHIARASELLPHLQRFGEVDIFLSGSNAQLNSNLPVKFRDRGISLFYKTGGTLDYMKIARQILNPFRIIKSAMALPVEKYDLIINDFEFITSLACRLKKVPSVQFGHQASFHSDFAPRPEKSDPAGEWILSNYCHAHLNLGLHFKPYDEQITWPIIKSRIWNSTPKNLGYVAVYLPQLSMKEIYRELKSLNNIRFQVFCKEANYISQQDNITWFPIDNEMFTQSMLDCHGVITGGGFETPAECMFLGKKLMVFPISGQYEQKCNAAALREWNIPELKTWDINTGAAIDRWYQSQEEIIYKPQRTTAQVVDWMFELSSNHLNRKNHSGLLTFPRAFT